MHVVSATGLTKYYGSLRAVHRVDLEIMKGECFGFLGPNGAGKTTVMGIIYCFLPPSDGRVRVFGLDVTSRQSEIKARLGVMPQEDNLDPDLTVFENMIVYARYFDIQGKEATRRARHLLGFVELEEKADTKIGDLSGGMKRRLVLARSLINNPEILILDEPTTGLDPLSRRTVWKKLNQLKEKSTTLVLTTHYMEEAERFCDRVAIMNAGTIITVESPKRLMELHGGNLEDVYLAMTGKPLAEKAI